MESVPCLLKSNQECVWLWGSILRWPDIYTVYGLLWRKARRLFVLIAGHGDKNKKWQPSIYVQCEESRLAHGLFQKYILPGHMSSLYAHTPRVNTFFYLQFSTVHLVRSEQIMFETKYMSIFI